jgi:hypothetical protein
MRWYLAGPMSGIKDDNFPAFFAAAERLRAEGLIVVNPAENPKRESWAGYMRDAIASLVTCQGAIFLPGWERSRGARREHSIACDLEMAIRYLG